MKTAKGTFWNRFSIILVVLVFAVLTFWAVSYLLDDIRIFKMPNRHEYISKHTDKSLKIKLDVLEMQVKDLTHQHNLLSQQRGFIKDSSGSLQIIVDNLFKLKNRNQDLISKEQFAGVLASLDKIISIQDDYKSTANDFIKTTNDKYALQKQIAKLKKRIKDEQIRVGNAYSAILKKHRIKTTIAKFAFLIPLAIIATLLKQYKEAYNRFLCPVCEYPIRIGPRKYLYWTRRTVHKISLLASDSPTQDEKYTCPSCGTCLFDECNSCNRIRHTLLPNCQSCGNKTDITGKNY